MKRIYFCLIFLILGSVSYSSELDHTATFIRVWGYLKYHHPEVVKGKFDWDEEFLKRIDDVQKESDAEFNQQIYEWINSLGDITKSKSSTLPDSGFLNVKPDSSLFYLNGLDLKNRKLLQDIHSKEITNHYYNKRYLGIGLWQPANEKEYEDSVFPGVQLRLLGLARYWNYINYFYPYKYSNPENWNEVLVTAIPDFLNAKTKLEYDLAVVRLIGAIHDCHAYIFTKELVHYYGKKWPPFEFRIIDSKIIVTRLNNDSLCKLNDILVGDVISAINDQKTETVIHQTLSYVSISNPAVRNREMSWMLLRSNDDSIKVIVERKGQSESKYLHVYRTNIISETFRKAEPGLSYYFLNESTGYVNMGILKTNEVKKMMTMFRSAKRIIFDIRNYPQGTMYKIAEYLNTDKKLFVNFTDPDPFHPGNFVWKKPYYCGKNNADYYKGKVVLLVNEETQSHAEFTAMALQTAPDVITIGSQTAGADGNIVKLVFPGKIETYISGIGVYYPDSSETQRVGIKTDIIVHPTIEGIQLGKDEVLEKALLVR